MTKADIIRMAIEAEIICNEEGWCGWVEDTDLLPFIERFAELVRAEEREACAKVCDELDALNWSESGEYSSGYGDEIRKRGKQ